MPINRSGSWPAAGHLKLVSAFAPPFIPVVVMAKSQRSS